MVTEVKVEMEVRELGFLRPWRKKRGRRPRSSPFLLCERSRRRLNVTSVIEKRNKDHGLEV